jgi:hypothetical protein
VGNAHFWRPINFSSWTRSGYFRPVSFVHFSDTTILCHMATTTKASNVFRGIIKGIIINVMSVGRGFSATLTKI